MLIEDAIEEAKLHGKLFPARSTQAWTACPRAFLMCVPAFELVEAGKVNPDPAERHRWAQLEAAMSYFIEGGYVNDDLIKPLHDYKGEHWELRSRKPRPSLRMFGRFALPDVFVGTHIEPRANLGGMWSPEFEHNKLVCEDHWNQAGLGAPFSDSPEFRYKEYITENAEKKLRIRR